MSKPIFVGFYTNDYLYRKLATTLMQSLDKFGLDYDFLEVDRCGEDWIEHVKNKPYFILKMMEKHDRPVIWIDSDCEVLKYPSELLSVWKDAGLINWNPKKEVCNAVIYLANLLS